MTGDKNVDKAITWFLTIKPDEWIGEYFLRGMIILGFILFCFCMFWLAKGPDQS